MKTGILALAVAAALCLSLSGCGMVACSLNDSLHGRSDGDCAP